jgi:hypothetical protein
MMEGAKFEESAVAREHPDRAEVGRRLAGDAGQLVQDVLERRPGEDQVEGVTEHLGPSGQLVSFAEQLCSGRIGLGAGIARHRALCIAPNRPAEQRRQAAETCR